MFLLIVSMNTCTHACMCAYMCPQKYFIAHTRFTINMHVQHMHAFTCTVLKYNPSHSPAFLYFDISMCVCVNIYI